MNQVSAGALFLYTIAYSLSSLGAFALADSMGEEVKVNDLKGFSAKNPGMAVAMVILMLSLAGIPPVAGFFAKYYLFYGALMSGFTWLVLVAVLSSLIGVYYYFRIIYTMFQPTEGTEVSAINSNHRVLLVVAAVASLALGLFPEFLQRLF